ncbi:MAG: M23 family metallopeptidase [Oscillospiraceae bacterium]|jgi:murein DD-endopeptidase MepM/ murein hydrolase activator NlpD|nr:M23 family metallopeptidase [Oscillospiraceae bacterium]
MNYRTQSRRGTQTRIRGGAKLTACALIIGGALLAKYLFPEFADFARTQLNTANADTAVNYKAAFSAMGEVITGGAKPEAILTALVGRSETALFVSYEYSPGNGAAAFERLGADAKKIDGGVAAAISAGEGSAASGANAEAVLTFDYELEASPDGRVYAYNDGTVIADGDSSLYGKYLIIYHGDLTAEYYHCTELNVKSGDSVVKGQQIAVAE